MESAGGVASQCIGSSPTCELPSVGWSAPAKDGAGNNQKRASNRTDKCKAINPSVEGMTGLRTFEEGSQVSNSKMFVPQTMFTSLMFDDVPAECEAT